METVYLSMDDIEIHEREIVALLKESYKQSFPTITYEDNYFYEKISELKSYKRVKKANLFGALVNHKLVGFIWFFEISNRKSPSIHINHFVINKQYQNCGFGSQLLEAVETFALERRISEINLNVTNENKDALLFYQRKGYVVKTLYLRKVI